MYKWNTTLSFYRDKYLVLAAIGWIGNKDLRYLNSFGETFGSIFANVLCVFSVLFPVGLTVLYYRKLKPCVIPPRVPEGKLTAEEIFVKYGSAENYLRDRYNPEAREKFDNKYGDLIYHLNDVKLGRTLTVVFLVFPLFREFMLVMAVT